MRCYNCGAELTINPFCTNCGADIREYRRIIWTSNQYYNDGLTKAKVRDLSGAVLSLRACLKLNRTNIEARNLLGLVYFEMGEAVAAFAEWVVSKSLKPDRNIADDFMDTIQSNPGRLDTINHSIKKYNQALSYARQGSLDLSVIQLKKVLQMNPNLVVAYELLGLLYLQGEEYNRARRILNQALRIDRNNTRVLYYLKEAEEGIAARYSGDPGSSRRRRSAGRASADAITYTSGNETIIQPVNSGDRGGSSALLNIIIGAVIGCLLMLFLVLPSRIRSANNKMNDQLKELSDEITEKDADIEEQKKTIASLQSENNELKGSIGDLSGESGMAERYDYLAEAALNYIKDPDDVTGTESMLALIPTGSASANAINLEIETVGDLDPAIYSQSFRSLYNYLDNDVSSRAARSYIDKGKQEFEDGHYQSAIEDLLKATEIAPLNDEAWYYLAESYKQSGDSIHATQAYSRIVNEMADSEYADKARTNLSNGAAADNTNEDQAGNNDTADQDNTDNGEAAAPDADADLIAQALAMQALQAGAGADTETGAE
ncbi:MAG: tetratricopeptide repeat protein [Lachnospiraceae bacterium]|nr:tetratricopeptide repeat protein [Lachnospiraceae bacterium]